jgi:hypothetical protein
VQVIQEYFHLFAALTGALCAYEAQLILKIERAWINDKRLLWSTTFEFVWLIITCLGLFSWNFTGVKAFACLIFLVNYLVACVYTFFLIRSSDLEALEQFQLPRWYLEYYFSFGVIYFLANIFLFF